MKTHLFPLAQLLALVALIAGCGGGGGGGTTTTTTTTCTLTEDTTATANTSPDGCAVLTRDTSDCTAARVAQGLTGFWLKFSCRVSLTKSGNTVIAVADGLPDTKSNYFATTDPCYDAFTGNIQNPNQIATQAITITFPLTPDTNLQTMNGTAIVGLALNGVPIFGNFAAPGDDIYEEAETFDRCGAHPQAQGKYHYHGEPYSISYDDSNFIGVMRDGYPIYGRRDPDNTIPNNLDNAGGHTGFTPDSPAVAVWHYHLNLQTSTNIGTLGQQQWFLTKGNFKGTPGACTGCN